MKMRFLLVAAMVWLGGCVSDDQPNALASESSSSSPSQLDTPTSTSEKSPTSEESTSTSGPTSTERDNDQQPDSSTGPSDNTSDSSERAQGKPITVTTVGSEAIGKKSVKSNVTVTDSWCEASETGALLALAEIANTATLEGDFIVEFEVLNALGVRVGEGVDVVHAVKPGQSFVARETVSDAVGWEGDARSWTCQVLRISTPDAVLSD